MVGGFQRHTPEPAKVRFAAATLAIAGACVALPGALLPIWMLRFALTSRSEGQAFLILVAGFAVGALAAGRLRRAYGPRIRMQLLLGSVAIAAGATLLLSAFQTAALLAAFGAVGFGLGALTSGAAWLLFGSLSPRRAPAVLNLAGASFGAGCVGMSLLAWLAADQASLAILLLPLLGANGLLVTAALRSRLFTTMVPPVRPAALNWVETARPAAILLALALFAQAATVWLAGGWLAIYFARGLGMSTRLGLLLLAGFWLAFTVGRVAATRLRPLSVNAWPIVWSALASLMGCVFVLNSPQTSGAVAGTLLVGMSAGVMHPLTTRIISERFPYYHPGLLNGVFSLSVVGGALAPGLAGYFMAAWGVELIVYLLGGAAIVSAFCLTAVLLEVHLMEIVTRSHSTP